MFTGGASATTICHEIIVNYPSNEGEIELLPSIQKGQVILGNNFNFLPVACYLESYTPSSPSLKKLDIYFEAIREVKSSGSTYAALSEDVGLGVGLKIENAVYSDVRKGWKMGTVGVARVGNMYRLGAFSLTSDSWAWYKVYDFKPGIYTVSSLSTVLKISVYDGENKIAEYPLNSPLIIGFKVINNACTFENDVVETKLDVINRSAFKGISSTFGYRDANVLIKCIAPTNYSISISSYNIVNSITEHLVSTNSSTSAGASTGVGIELLYNNTPITKSETQYIVKNIVGSEGMGEYLQFGAQYYQLEDEIKPGDITSYFTLNVNYN